MIDAIQHYAQQQRETYQKERDQTDKDKKTINDLYLFLSKSMECQDPFAEFDASKYTSNVLQIKQCENAVYQRESTQQFSDSIEKFIQSQDNHFIGKKIAILPLQTMQLEEGKNQSFAYKADKDYPKVTIRVYDQENKLVFQAEEKSKKGHHHFEWNGTQNVSPIGVPLENAVRCAPGAYKVQVVAPNNQGKERPLTVLQYAQVTATERGENHSMLFIKNDQDQYFKISTDQLKQSGYCLMT